LNRIEQRQLAACRKHGLIRSIVRAKITGVPLHDGLANLRNARNGRVAGEVGVNGLNGGVLDVTRRGEVGLAGAETDEVHTFGAQPRGLGGYGHGGRDFNASNAVGEDAGGSCCTHGASIFSDFRRVRGEFWDVQLRCRRSRSITNFGTNPSTDPPSSKISFTSRELTKEYLPSGMRKMVSNSGDSRRFINAICSSYS